MLGVCVRTLLRGNDYRWRPLLGGLVDIGLGLDEGGSHPSKVVVHGTGERRPAERVKLFERCTGRRQGRDRLDVIVVGSKDEGRAAGGGSAGWRPNIDNSCRRYWPASAT